MEHDITRKVLKGNPESFDSPGESLPDTNGRVEEDHDDFGGEEDLDRLPSLDEGAGDDEPFPKYSLDDFAAAFSSTSDNTPRTPVNVSLPQDNGKDRRALFSRLGFLLRNGPRKLCFTILSILIIASSVGVTVQQYGKKPADPKVERRVNGTIKRSIQIPSYTEQTELIVFGGAESEKNLISMRLEFMFSAENAYRDFQRDIVSFRDLVYQFASKERPGRNSQKGWQEVVEKKLLEYLKAAHPKSGVHSVRIAHWERL